MRTPFHIHAHPISHPTHKLYIPIKGNTEWRVNPQARPYIDAIEPNGDQLVVSLNQTAALVLIAKTPNVEHMLARLLETDPPINIHISTRRNRREIDIDAYDHFRTTAYLANLFHDSLMKAYDYTLFKEDTTDETH